MTKAPEMRDRSVVRLSGHAVDKIVLLWIAADIGEGQHDERQRARRLGNSSKGARLGGRSAIEALIDTRRRAPGRADVLERLVAEIDEGLVQAVARVLISRPGENNSAWLADPFKTCCRY